MVEGLYQNYADICPLPKLVELKTRYKFRVILDETYSIGVLGKQGKGVTDYFNIPVQKIDILTGSLSTCLGAAGGFCLGATHVTDHQRLSGQGYCFSASMPAMLAASGIEAIKILENNPSTLSTLRENTKLFRKLASEIPGLAVVGNEDSPIIVVRLKNRLENRDKEEDLLQAIVDKCLDQGVLFSRAKYVLEEEINPPLANIRVTVSSAHSEEQITNAVNVLKNVANQLLG